MIKHAQATEVTVHLSRHGPTAGLRIVDDGRGMGAVDLDDRGAAGHLGLVSRRIRLEAVGGSMRHLDAQP